MDLDNESFYIILDTINASIYWKDINGKYLGCNRYMLEMAGISDRRDLIGKNDALLPWRDYAAEINRIDRQVLEHGHYEGEEYPLTKFQGRQIFHTKKSVLRNKYGEMLGIIGISINITEKKNAEFLLQEKQRLLEKSEAASQAKTEFLENMRHDIRTPLTGIIGFSDIIKSEAKSSNLKEYADNLVESSYALLKLMDEVLETVHISSGRVPGVKKKFSLKDTLQHIINLNRAKASSKKLKLKLDYDEKMPNYVIGDNIRIHRILLNLVSNALNFTDSGFVNIKAEFIKEEDKQIIVKLIVRDSGIGIPPEQKQEIFLQFKRLTPSYQGIYKGTGLGLFIVKQFIDEIDGEIYVDSELNKGTTFTCVIPLKRPLLNDDSGIDKDEMVVDCSKFSGRAAKEVVVNKKDEPEIFANRILVVEDNPIAQMVTRKILQQLNCQVDLAINGKEALQLWKHNSYDLIFMDIGLPDLDGCEVTHRIRVQEVSNKSYLPIVALTAHAGDENKSRCISAGMNAVLTKPLTAQKCEETLKSFLTLRNQKKDESIESYISNLPDDEQQMFDISEYKILDVAVGLDSVGTKDMLAEMLEILAKQALPDDLKLMQEAHDADDWDKTKLLAHKIKGGAVYVGTIKLQMACQFLEQCCKSEQHELLEPLYQQVVSVIEESIQEIKSWLNVTPK